MATPRLLTFCNIDIVWSRIIIWWSMVLGRWQDRLEDIIIRTGVLFIFTNKGRREEA
jgi:hypothetical protein